MKNYKNIVRHFVSGFILIMIFVVPFFVLAAIEGGDSGTGEGGDSGVNMNIKINNPFKQDTIPGLINTIISDILIPIGAVVAVLMIMYAGFIYVTARGDTTKIKKAHEALLYAVIGAAILLGAKIISVAIDKTIQQLK